MSSDVKVIRENNEIKLTGNMLDVRQRTSAVAELGLLSSKLYGVWMRVSDSLSGVGIGLVTVNDNDLPPIFKLTALKFDILVLEVSLSIAERGSR